MNTPKDMTKELPEFKPSRIKDWIRAKVQNFRKVVIPIFLENPKKKETRAAKDAFAKYNPPDPIPDFKPRPKSESVPTSSSQPSEPKPASAEPDIPSSQPSQPKNE
ncbi:hypothetical protein HYR99_39205 [Candidatus Poribacteria bacterium]|nr:hypothetical protein [Candidatus Poribacteria bacterium]